MGAVKEHPEALQEAYDFGKKWLQLNTDVSWKSRAHSQRAGGLFYVDICTEPP